MNDIHGGQYGSVFLREHAQSILDFARNSHHPLGGYGYLDSKGYVDRSKPRETYQQGRFVHTFGLAHLMGFGDYRDEVAFGINALRMLMHDKKYGGYFNAIDDNGDCVGNEKLCYDQAFVLLAATTARAVGVDGAAELFNDIDAIIDKYFWDSEFNMVNNHWDNSFTTLDPYRGINSSMHSVEAFLGAYDLTGDKKFFDRAYAITRRTIDGFAKNNKWFLPEHFSDKWIPDLEFNKEKPADPFRPYGVTIGHLFEWARLAIHLHHGLDSAEDQWMIDGALGMYEVAKKYGWAPDGGDGFVYTLDWQGKPVTTSRMWWVPSEAVLTAYVLNQELGADEYASDYHKWWSYIDTHFIDHKDGLWFAELDRNQKLVSGTWSGKPDIYHVFQAAVLPLLPPSHSFVGSALKYKNN